MSQYERTERALRSVQVDRVLQGVWEWLNAHRATEEEAIRLLAGRLAARNEQLKLSGISRL